MGSPPEGFTLRTLPLPARLVLAVFLISVGIGYLSALVQLHFQHAGKGQVLPGPDDTVRVFHDKNYGKPPEPPKGKIEELLEADPDAKFNGTGQMRTAFTTNSSGWEKAIDKRAKKDNVPPEEAKKVLEKEREGERLALLAWLKADAPKESYESDSFPLPADWDKEQPVTKSYLTKDGQALKLKKLIDDRCVRCHGEGEAADFPLDSYEHVQKYLLPPEARNAAPVRQPAMGKEKLAQSTHVHLLGFSMLYALTGLLFAFTTYPTVVRLLLGPLPLVVQVIDIGCWWAARLDGPYGVWAARAIPVTGGIVALGLLAHLVLGLFNLFGRTGKFVLVLAFAGALAGGYVWVRPEIENELRNADSASEKEEKPDPTKGKKDEAAKEKDAKGKKKDGADEKKDER
jgi:hypothetical protein